jgi:hypothetical protein
MAQSGGSAGVRDLGAIESPLAQPRMAFRGSDLSPALKKKWSPWAVRSSHVALYHKFGFGPRFLTAVMSKSVDRATHPPHWSRYSDTPNTEHAASLEKFHELTDAVYEGLDLQMQRGNEAGYNRPGVFLIDDWR